jgi:hypothetical protein
LSSEEVRAQLELLGLDEGSVRVVVAGGSHQGAYGKQCEAAAAVRSSLRAQEVGAGEYCSSCQWDDAHFTLVAAGAPAKTSYNEKTSNLLKEKERFERVLRGEPSSLHELWDAYDDLDPEWKRGALTETMSSSATREVVRKRIATDLLEWVGRKGFEADANDLAVRAGELREVGAGAGAAALEAAAATLRGTAASPQEWVLADLRLLDEGGWRAEALMVLEALAEEQGSTVLVPSGVLRLMLHQGGLERCEVLVGSGEALEVLEAARVLHAPRSDGTCSTLTGALEVARAL